MQLIVSVTCYAANMYLLDRERSKLREEIIARRQKKLLIRHTREKYLEETSCKEMELMQELDRFGAVAFSFDMSETTFSSSLGKEVQIPGLCIIICACSYFLVVLSLQGKKS